MSRYCGPTETAAIVPLFPQVATSTAGYTSTLSLLDNLIPRVSSEIDGYCARRYSLPLGGATDETGAVPPLIRTICMDMVARRGINALYASDSVNKDEWADQYDMAIENLKLIREGKLFLSDSNGSILTRLMASSKLQSNNITYSPTFGQDTATSWKVDGDKLSDISDERGS